MSNESLCDITDGFDTPFENSNLSCAEDGYALTDNFDEFVDVHSDILDSPNDSNTIIGSDAYMIPQQNPIVDDLTIKSKLDIVDSSYIKNPVVIGVLSKLLNDHDVNIVDVQKGNFYKHPGYTNDPIETLTTADSREADIPDISTHPSHKRPNHNMDSPVNEFPFEHPTGSEYIDELVSSGKDHSDRIYTIIRQGFDKLTLKMGLFMLIFIITNSAQPLLICLLRKHGGTPNGTYTFLFPTYLAMVCIGLYPTTKTIMQENWKYPLLLSFLDIIHQVIEKAGLLYCGPSIYSIASSTNTMFLALFSKIILKKNITEMTWISIGLISGSLAINGAGESEHITSAHILGFVLVILAAIVNALNSVIGEDILKRNQIEGPNLVCMMGLISLTTFMIWTVFWTIPQRNILFANDGQSPFDLNNVLRTLFTLFLSNLGRSSVYYYIIKESGSVSCGVLKAVRIIIVVIGGHVLFSSIDKTQTISTIKILSSIICSVGVIMYSLEKSLIHSEETRT